MKLVCEECRHKSDESARGWQGYLIAAGDDEGVNADRIAVFFCPFCAEREFGRSSTISERQPGW